MMPFMVKKNSWQKFIPDLSELKFAAWITINCLLALLIYLYWTTNLGIWVIMSAGLLPLSVSGRNQVLQNLDLIKWGFFSAIAVVVTLLLKNSIYLLLPWFFFITYVLYTLPRYQYNSRAAGIVILAFIAMAAATQINSMTFQIAWKYGLAILVGMAIAFLVTVAAKLNSISKEVSQLCHSRYLKLRALRMAIIVTTAIFITHLFNFQNSAWVIFSIIVSSQSYLGSSIRKAWQRTLGTILGIVVGMLLAYLIFSTHPATLVLAVPLVFITFAVMARSYVISLFTATILVTCLFYLMHYRGESVGYFLLTRLGDTVLGVTLVLLGEWFIFPRSLLAQIRVAVINFWQESANFIDFYMNHSAFSIDDNKTLQQLIDNMKVEEQKIKEYLMDFQYEPYRFISKRYPICVSLFTGLSDLIEVFIKLYELKIDVANFQFRKKIFSDLANILFEIAKKNRVLTVEHIDHYKKLLVNNKCLLSELNRMNENNQTFDAICQELLITVEKLLNYYQLALEVRSR